MKVSDDSKLVCDWCDTEVEADSVHKMDASGHSFHRECLLRIVVGNVEHQRGECSCFGGTDPEETDKRESAKQATEEFEKHGFRSR